MKTAPTIPCVSQPDLFTGNRMTNAQRRQAATLCRTQCPAAQFAACAELEPVPGTVMAGVAYGELGQSLRLTELEGPTVCIGERCSKPLPGVRGRNGKWQVWCERACYDAHRYAAKADQRAEVAARKADNGDAADLLKGLTTWRVASRAARLAVVRHYVGKGWSDPQIAYQYGITARRVRWVRECAGIAGNKFGARGVPALKAC